MNSAHTHRFVARFVVEADTPLFVGSGESSLLKDALVSKDVNGFPMIPGTSITGILRHSLDEGNSEIWNSIFGDTDTKGAASRLKVSSAYMMLNESTCSEGIINSIELDPIIVKRFTNLPSRQHVRINEKGVAVKNGLFDNEIVYKGTRFIFEIELRGNDTDNNVWLDLINFIQNPTFRIGSGTRNGYGRLKVVKNYNCTFDLQNSDSFEKYLNFKPSLNAPIQWNVTNLSAALHSNYTRYDLHLIPDSFFIFSEGFGDEDVDNKPKEEETVIYSDKGLHFTPKNTVIPASSIKGALSHRVAYHYNKMKMQFEANGKTYTDNDAVYELFGDMSGTLNREPRAGNVFLDDLYLSEGDIVNDKIFNHVAIDRFTGGAIQGALFSEKVSNLLIGGFNMSIYVKQNEYSEYIIDSLEMTLEDVCKGLLPLGGMTTKGNGMFTGQLSRNGEVLFNYASI